MSKALLATALDEIALSLQLGDWITDGELRTLLRSKVEEAGGVRALARAWGMDASNLHKVLRGAKPASESILARLGLRREIITRYHPVKRRRGGG